MSRAVPYAVECVSIEPSPTEYGQDVITFRTLFDVEPQIIRVPKHPTALDQPCYVAGKKYVMKFPDDFEE